MAATVQTGAANVPLHQASSRKWIRFTKGDCPICQGARKDRDCRQSPKGTVHCRSGNPAPNGWRFMREDSLGFGIYVPDQGKTKSQSAPFKRPFQPTPKQPKLQVLDAVERDRQFRQIAKHSGLSQRHRAKLQDRGVSAATIQQWYDSGLVWSWAAGESIPGTCIELPGIDPATGGLRQTFHGMAIAIPSVDNHLLGAQIKRDGKGGNYFWVSSDAVGGNNQRLTNGETPMGVYGQSSPVLNFCEGYLKGAVAADRHGLCCVGMMGGHWANAPEQLRNTIKHTRANTCILNPDAGMLDWKHRTVILAYSRLESLLRQWGYTLQVRWWGQREKSDGDIDEISPAQFAQAQLISWTTFLEYLDYEWDIERVARSLLWGTKTRLDRATTQFLRDRLGYKPPAPILKNHLLENHLLENHAGRSPETLELQTAEGPKKAEKECCAITRWQPEKKYFLAIEPGTVPTFEQFLDMGSPQLYAPRNQHNEILAEMLQKGYRVILENGTGGDGKTHRAGDFAAAWPSTRLRINGCKQGTLHFTSPNYRNPDTTTVEQIEEKVSPAALDEDATKLTPLGHPYRKRHLPRRDAAPDIPGLCSEDNTIQRLQHKGLAIDRGFQSDYCQTVCGQAFNCPYLGEQQAQGQPAVIREHISTITLTPTPSTPSTVPEGEAPQNGDVIMVDEASRTLSPYSKAITATIHDIAQEIGRFSQSHLDLYGQYKPVFDALSHGIQRTVAESGGSGSYNIPLATVLKFLPTLQHLESLFFQCHFETQYQSWITAQDVWRWEGDRKVNSLGQLMVILHRTSNPRDWVDAIDAAKKNGMQVSGEVLERWVSPQPLYRLYGVIKGVAAKGTRTNLTVSPSGLLTFTYHDPRITTPLRNARVILMDATPNLWGLSRVLGVQPQEIVRLADYRPSFPNLKIKVISGLGNTCASRASLNQDGTLVRQGQYDIQQRTVKLVEAIANPIARANTRRLEGAVETKVGLLDYRKFMDTYRNIPNLVTGYCFNDNRGSNRFKGCSTLISVAIATPNLGTMLNQYYLMTGHAHTLQDAPGSFWAWQRQGQINELLQDGFRLRAQHRLEADLEWYILSDQLDQSMVEAIRRAFPGCTVEKVPVVQICSDAATKSTQVQYSLVKTLYQQIVAGEKATIDAIAHQVGRTKGRISQIAKLIDPGGFRAVRQSLEMLYRNLNSEIKLAELPDDAQFLALTYLPEIATQLVQGEMSAQEAHAEFRVMAEAYSESGFEAILAATPAESIATLIASFLPLTGDGVLEWVTTEMRSRLDACLGVP